MLSLNHEVVEVRAGSETGGGAEFAVGVEEVHDVAAVEIDADGLNGRGGGGHELPGEEVAGLSTRFGAEFGSVYVGEASAEFAADAETEIDLQIESVAVDDGEHLGAVEIVGLPGASEDELEFLAKVQARGDGSLEFASGPTFFF